MLTPLTRKVFRDLWRMRAQATSVAMVLGCGVATLIMAKGMQGSLEEARDDYYERYGMADVRAVLVRAPQRLGEEIAQWPKIAALEWRQAAQARINVRGVAETLSAQVLSLPNDRLPEVNRPLLVEGRLPEPNAPQEVMINEAFAQAHGLQLGDSLNAIINGHLLTLTLIGMANSPEFVFVSGANEPFPQPARYAVMWMRESAMARLVDLEGAFNDMVIRVTDPNDIAWVKEGVHQRLSPYGGIEPYGRESMISARFLTEEMAQLGNMAKVLPPIFLFAAVFLFNVTLTRLVFAERANIGLLKAFGVSNLAIARHYTTTALLIGALGLGIGLMLGAFMGSWMASIYRSIYRLPDLPFAVEWSTWGWAIGVSFIASLLGALSAVARAVSMNPAFALAPPAPPHFKGALRGIKFLASLDPLTRVIIRRMVSAPRRSLSTIMGFALALSVLVVAQHFPQSINRFIEVVFHISKAKTTTITTTQTLDNQALHDIARIDGVLAVEPFYAVRVRYGLNEVRVQETLMGVVRQPQLEGLMDAAQIIQHVRDDGLVMSGGLARQLGAKVGDAINIQVIGGRRQNFSAPVVQVIDSWVGSSAFIDINRLGEWLQEPHRFNGAHLRLAEGALDRFNTAVANIPFIASVSHLQSAERAMREIFDQGSGFFATLFLVIASILSAGVAFATASVTLAEQERDLATLQVLGYSHWQTSYILAGEIMLLALLSLPFGLYLGYLFALWLIATMSNELFSFPLVVEPALYTQSALFVLLCVAVTVAWVRRAIDRLNLVSALKSRE